MPQPSIEEITDNFALLDEWDDRYRYLIELGRGLDPLAEEAHNETNKVRGCASQVWLETTIENKEPSPPILSFRGDSDAHIVRGLVALAIALFSGHTAEVILATDANRLFEDLGLIAHLSPQRSNGVRSMVERIKTEARAALHGAQGHVSASA